MILDEIVKKTKFDLKERKDKISFNELERLYASDPYLPKDAKAALKSTLSEPLRIIAEVKKASPSKGLIREKFEPVLIARDYELGGANVISVLTEPHYFLGDLQFLAQIRRQMQMPLLRKDFIVDKYQILEALVYGADLVLLIAKCLSQDELKELLDYSHGLGLSALVETHDETDVQKALAAGANIIGINHRNLDDFTMDMSLCSKLIPLIPKDKIIVAESGLYEHGQLLELNKMGVDAFLIGEYFMRQNDLVNAVKTIKEG